MEYHEAANTLFDLRRFAPRPGTAPTEALLEHLDDPHDDIDCVQIAGSNGKGSTARMLASILEAAGLDVGLYTSPHLDSIGERIQVNGRHLSDAGLAAFVETVEPYLTERAADGDSPTFFETVTALALWEFGRQDVDVAVLEVGIGGKLDATSAVDPVAAGLTSVTLEHTDVLGDSVEAIARDKATVAPEDRPLVTAATEPALSAIRDEVGEVLCVGEARGAGNGDAPSADVRVEHRGRDGLEGLVGIEGPNWTHEGRLALLGRHQARNAGVAVSLARQIGVDDADAIGLGLRRAHWPGRFEVMGREPLVVLDGAHNPGACTAVRETLADFEFDDLHVIAGVMTDKDHRGIAAALGDADRVTTCRPDRARAEDQDVLAAAFEREIEAPVDARSDVRDATEAAIAEAAPGDAVLVVGSLYTVAEARTRWSRPVVETRVDSIADAEAALSRASVTPAGTWRMRGKAVHRVLRTRVRPRQAQYLKEELLSLGGECAVAGIDADTEQNVPVALMATMAQYNRLTEKLQGQPYGLASLADEIRRAVGIGANRTAGEFPWTGEKTAVMGILNVTPDSFYDGGRFVDVDDAVARAEDMVAAGADLVDVGGESTRPGAEPVSVDEETARIVPVIESIDHLDALVSVDTRKAPVARAALDAGADLINDVSGLADPEMPHVAAESGVPLVVMHSIDTPVSPERSAHYDDVVEDVIDSLSERVQQAARAGLDRSQIIVDPGLGFGKAGPESLQLLDRLGEFAALGCPVMVGHSRKSMFEWIEPTAADRLHATVAGTTIAAQRGADIVRVHDVAANRDAVDVVKEADRAGRSTD